MKEIINLVYRMLTGQDVPKSAARPVRRYSRMPRVSWYPPRERSREFIASNDFLQTWQWNKVRYRALERSDGQCCLCGRSKKNGVTLNVDHIYPRARYPHLCLTVEATQVLCSACNQGKGNESTRDWR